MKKIFSIITSLLLSSFVISCGVDSGSGEAELEGIKVDSSGAKTYFYSGDTFTASGLVVRTSYTDGSTKKVALKNCSFSMDSQSVTLGSTVFSDEQKGTHNVTVSYKGYSQNYSIYVVDSSKYAENTPTFLDNYVSISAWSNRDKWNLANTHDPTVFKWTDGYYYMFGTDASYGNAHDSATTGKHFFGKRSVDLVNWEYVNGVMDEAPDWVVTKLNEFRSAQGLSSIAKSDISFGFWAPCARVVSVNGTKKVRMYYSIVVDNYIGNGKSATDTANFDNTWGERAFIGVTESTNPSGGPSAWEDKGFVVCSSSDKGKDGYSRSSLSDYDAYFYFNAIDPSYFIDEDETHWLVYGSWHSGFALVRINPSTGKVAAVDGTDYLSGNVTGDFEMGYPWSPNGTIDDKKPEELISQGYGTRIFKKADKRGDESRWQPTEGPELVKYDGKYWLFFANLGLDVPYHTRVVCADSVTGPYKTISGGDVLSENITGMYPLVTHPYKFLDEEPASDGYGSCYGWVGISHCAIFDDGNGNWFYMSQQRLPKGVAGLGDNSNALMMGGVRRIIWSPTGSSVNDKWPMVLPERYGGLPANYNPDENAEDGKIAASEIAGAWQHINLSYDATEKGNMDEAVLLSFESESEGSSSGTIKDSENAAWGTWSFSAESQTMTITQSGKSAVTVSLARELDWEKVPRVPTIVYTGANNANTNGYTYWGKKGEATSAYPYKFFEATCTQDLGDSPAFYLIQQMGTIVVTDSKGTDTSKEYSSSATEWWKDDRKNTSSLTLSDGESITWTVKVTSSSFGLVLEGKTGETYLDLNMSYNSSADAWGGGTWAVTSSDNDAYGINGHTYTITVSRNGNVYTISATDLGAV